MPGNIEVRHVVVHSVNTWWVINTSPGSGTPTIYTVLQGTSDDANNFPGGGISGPYNSLSAADSKAQHEPVNDTGIGGQLKAVGAGIKQGAGQISGAGPGANALGDTFHGLKLGNWLLRIGEIVLGIVLVGVGLAHVTGTQNMITNALKTAAKTAAVGAAA